MRMKWYGAGASLLASTAVPLVNLVSDNLGDYRKFQVSARPCRGCCLRKNVACACQAMCVLIAAFSHFCLRYTGRHARTVYDDSNSEATVPFSASPKSSPMLVSKTPNEDSSPWRLTWQIMRERDFLAFVSTNFLQIFHATFWSNFMSIFVDELVPVHSRTKSFIFGLLFTGGSVSAW